MMDLGCYPLHWALTVMGAAPIEVSAKAELTPTGVEESLKSHLVFESGAEAFLNCSMAADQKFTASMRLVGSKGEIRFTNPLAPQLGARLELSQGPMTRALTEISPITTYTYQLGAVATAIDAQRSLPTEGEMILRQQTVLDEIYAAAGLRHLRYLEP